MSQTHMSMRASEWAFTSHCCTAKICSWLTSFLMIWVFFYRWTWFIIYLIWSWKIGSNQSTSWKSRSTWRLFPFIRFFQEVNYWVIYLTVNYLLSDQIIGKQNVHSLTDQYDLAEEMIDEIIQVRDKRIDNKQQVEDYVHFDDIKVCQTQFYSHQNRSLHLEVENDDANKRQNAKIRKNVNKHFRLHWVNYCNKTTLITLISRFYHIVEGVVESLLMNREWL